MSKKTNWSSIILWVALAGLVGKLWLDSYTGKLKFGKPSISFQGLTFSGLLPSGVTLGISIPITNGNSESATISKFTGSVFYGPVKLGDLTQPQPITIVANGTTNYIIQEKVTFKDLADEIKNDFKTGNYLQSFYLRGSMTVGSITVPIDQQLTVLF